MITVFRDLAQDLQWTAWTIVVAAAGAVWLVLLLSLAASRAGRTPAELYYAPFFLATAEALQVWKQRDSRPPDDPIPWWLRPFGWIADRTAAAVGHPGQPMYAFLALDVVWAAANTILVGLLTATIASEVGGQLMSDVGEAFTVMVVVYFGVEFAENLAMWRMLDVYDRVDETSGRPGRKTSWVLGNLVAHLNVIKWLIIATSFGYLAVGVGQIHPVGWGLAVGAAGTAVLAAFLVPAAGLMRRMRRSEWPSPAA